MLLLCKVVYVRQPTAVNLKVRIVECLRNYIIVRSRRGGSILSRSLLLAYYKQDGRSRGLLLDQNRTGV
jgi:hypothetical protein